MNTATIYFKNYMMIFTYQSIGYYDKFTEIYIDGWGKKLRG